MEKRDSTQLLQRRLLAHELRQNVPGLILAVVILAGAFGGIYWMLSRRSADVAGAPERDGAVTVTEVRYAPSTPESGRGLNVSYLELDGRTSEFMLIQPWTPWLQPGKRVHVRYRIGRTGRWYVDHLEPEGGS